MEHLRVYKSPYPKVRIGKNNDGGYVICDIDSEYDILISAGIDVDCSFEEQLLNKYSNLHCVAYDGFIDSLPINSSSKIIFIKKNIGLYESDTTTNLKFYFKNFNNIFLKMIN
jgi:hypothetical protein